MNTQQFGTSEPLDGLIIRIYSNRLNTYFIAHNIGQVAADVSEQPNSVKISLMWVKQLILRLKIFAFPCQRESRDGHYS